MRKICHIALITALVLAAMGSVAFAESISTVVVAEQVTVSFINIDEFKADLNKTTVIDVRSANGRAKSRFGIPSAIWIDPDSGPAIDNFIATADKMKPYTIFCACTHDEHSIQAAQLLTKNGFKHITVLKGGWKAIIVSDINTMPLDS